ncbi:unnamed protein product, partial [Amoebophrya sp. A25]|eukprot:GSA25T00011014001.1
MVLLTGDALPRVEPQSSAKVQKRFGWGYRDSYFFGKEGVIRFAGERYPISGCNVPNLV